eukprot:TRINITY_DN2636_c0_g1_i1.p1 TRINITY_DN2636_c0_g1~~TRINITY_DN2636_c0_g1_i1.p1  ORF type:complete len:320 (+),score=82.32 TRINITY_DN2636_c0_g1_i1:96-1055(+)
MATVVQTFACSEGMSSPSSGFGASGSSCSSHEVWRQAQKIEDEQEDDRLSTAAPSLCEELDGEMVSASKATASRMKWADLVDSDDEEAPRSPAKAAPAKVRWADLAEVGGKLRSESACSGTSSSSAAGPSRQPALEKAKGCGKDARSSWQTKGYSGAASKQMWQPVQKSQGEQPGWRKTEQKGKGKGKGKGSGKGAQGGKSQCQFTIGIEEESRFRVCRRILGPQGQFMKEIAESTGARLRLRGRGSKFLEGPERQESTDPLMLCLSAPDVSSYLEAKRLVSALLEDVYQQFHSFKLEEGSVPKKLRLQIHEGPRPGSC